MPESPQSLSQLDPRQLESVIQRALTRQDLLLAEQACAQLRKLDASHPIPDWVMAQVERKRGNHHLAVDLLQSCVALRPEKRTFRMGLAKCLRREGRVDEALDQLDQLIQLDPSCHAALIEKANLLEHLGRYADSEAALALCPKSPEVTLVRANAAMHQGQFSSTIDLTRTALHDDQLDREQRAALLFLAGQAYAKLGEPQKALRELGLANNLLSQPLDRQRFREDVDRTLEFFTSDRVTVDPPVHTTKLPIFMACMPRSGSTLLERIIAAHPRAVGAGELDFFYTLRVQMMRSDRMNYPRCIGKLSRQGLKKIADAYLGRVERLRDAETCRLTDKSMENYRELGLIAMLFPEARLIHLTRSAVDCCLSIYMHPFYNLRPLTSSLRDIAWFYRQHQRCMSHWRDNVGLSILNVSYEELVANPQNEVRRVLAFCGLDWAPECLDFHKSDGLVRTLSYHQASRPIYDSSVGAGDLFRPYVPELLDELEQE